MKTVFNGNEIAHVWANLEGNGRDSHRYGRTSNSNQHFQGRAFYSYNNVIAVQMENVQGTVYTLMPTYAYSVTTARHQANVRNAVFGRLIEVDAYFSSDALLDITNEEVIDILHKELDTTKKKLETSRARTYDILQHLKSVAQDISFIQSDGWYYEWEEENREYLNTMAEKAAIEIEKQRERDAKRKEREREKYEQRRKEQERITYEKRTKMGEEYGIPVEEVSLDRIYLKIVDNEIVTSQGARVPKREARILYNRLKRGENIEGVKIGEYVIDRISDNIITIGCHKIPLSEVDRVIQPLVNTKE